jgi:hypothetical protein
VIAPGVVTLFVVGVTVTPDPEFPEINSIAIKDIEMTANVDVQIPC